MENNQPIEYDFNAERIMEMTKEEAISLLGEKNATRVNEGLKDGTLSYSEFERICKERFPIPQQARLVRNVIFNQLSQSEGFNMFESNKEKQAEYAKIANWREKAEKGELTRDDLKQLCDKVFGEDSELSRKIQGEFIAKGRVKQTDTQIETTTKRQKDTSNRINQEKKSWELNPEEKTKIQKDSTKIAQKHSEQEQIQKQTQNQEIEQGQNSNVQQYEQIQQQVPVQQQPIMDMGGMEL